MTGGDALELPGEKPVAISALDGAHEGWLPAYMAGQG
jgi:phosphoribosylformylglycinamidine synthase